MTCLPPAVRTHPLYPLRRGLLLASISGFLFAVLSLGGSGGYGYGYGNKGPFVFHLILATISALVNIYELARWAIAKLHRPHTEPNYPLKRMLTADVTLALLCSFTWSAEVGEAVRTSYGEGVVEAYASVTLLASAVLHAVCAWKQLMALKRKQWEEEVGQDGKTAETAEDCARYLRTRCPDCGARAVWYRHAEVPERQYTPPSENMPGHRDVFNGYEIIPDKMPEVDVDMASTGRKSKLASRPNSQTSLMEV